MKLSLFLLFSVAVRVKSLPKLKNTISKIYHGQPAAKLHQNVMENKGEYPYMASLQTINRHHLCGALIIKEDVILTAAHCTGNYKPTKLLVMAGSFNLHRPSKHEQIRYVKRYLNHHSHRIENKFNNDIALVWITLEFELGTRVNTIHLAGQDHSHKNAITLGWGKTEKDVNPDYLFRANLHVLTLEECQNFYRYTDRVVTSNMICGFNYFNAQGICSGDSGGPLVIKRGSKNKKDLLIGITSWGYTDVVNELRNRSMVTVVKCNPRYPSVFANIAKLRPWILSNINRC